MDRIEDIPSPEEIEMSEVNNTPQNPPPVRGWGALYEHSL